MKLTMLKIKYKSIWRIKNTFKKNGIYKFKEKEGKIKKVYVESINTQIEQIGLRSSNLTLKQTKATIESQNIYTTSSLATVDIIL